MKKQPEEKEHSNKWEYFKFTYIYFMDWDRTEQSEGRSETYLLLLERMNNEE